MPAPDLSIRAPNSTNRKMKEVDTPTPIPNTPSWVIQRWDIAFWKDAPFHAMMSGPYWPKKM